MPRQSHRIAAFTLIELLVVVTIIVVLLALLMPAMDKAIYQAELATCGANIKGITTAVHGYAFDHKRSYPRRSALITAVSDARPQTLYSAQAVDGVDDRRTLRDYLALSMFVDPLCEDIDLDPEITAADSFVYASYSLWYGWQFDGERGMSRVGDRFSWQDHRFNVLVSDVDSLGKGDGNFAQNSHPDETGMLVSQALQDEREFGVSWAFSLWTLGGRADRGPVDRNFGYTDGSVTRLVHVKVERNLTDRDTRVVQIPLRKAQTPGSYEYLPEH